MRSGTVRLLAMAAVAGPLLAGCAHGPSTSLLDRIDTATAIIASDSLTGSSTYVSMDSSGDNTSMCQRTDQVGADARITIGLDAKATKSDCTASTPASDLSVVGNTVTVMTSAGGDNAYAAAQTTPELAAGLADDIGTTFASAKTLHGVVADAKNVKDHGDTVTMTITLGSYQQLFGGLVDTSTAAKNETGTLTLTFGGDKLTSYSFFAKQDDQSTAAADWFRYTATAITAPTGATPYPGGEITTKSELDDFTQFTPATTDSSDPGSNSLDSSPSATN